MLKPTPKMKKWCFTGALILALLTVGTTPGIASDESNQPFERAIRGYDAVAYHTENLAMKGNSEFFYEWNNAEWHFASAENRDLFAADPERYATQYGGLCTGGLSDGQVINSNPKIFKIIDGKLYLAASKSSNLFKHTEKTIKKADESWAKINKEN